MGVSFSSRRMSGYKRKAPRRYVGRLKKKPWLRLWKRTKNATSHTINTRSGYDYIPLHADDTAVLLDADEVDTRNVKLLTDSNGAALDLYGPYQLMFACCHGYIDIVFELLSTHDRNDMDLNLPNNDGNTAFLLAIINGHTDIVDEFLKCDEVDVNHPNHKGDTALTWAANSGHMEIMDALLKHPGFM
jgi:ankyrin repeat protein